MNINKACSNNSGRLPNGPTGKLRQRCPAASNDLCYCAAQSSARVERTEHKHSEGNVFIRANTPSKLNQ